MDNEFFRALNNFTQEFASGNEIRHLADLGYTVSDIEKKLLYPTSSERVRKEYTKYMLSKGVLSLDGSTDGNICYDYISEQDEFGKRSFRRVEKEKCDENHVARNYVRCRFTVSGELKEELLLYLNPKQISYLKGIEWKMGILYHDLDERLTDIINSIPEKEREKFIET